MNNTTQQHDSFQWTDELVKQFSEYVGLRVAKSVGIREQINFLQEDFKKLHTEPKRPLTCSYSEDSDIKVKQPEQKPIEVEGIYVNLRNTLECYVNTTPPIPESKYKAVKKAIENALNQ